VNRIAQSSPWFGRQVCGLTNYSGLELGTWTSIANFIQPRTQADDRTRELRGLKTPKSRDAIPMTDETIDGYRIT
jgi:hypothetical protein